VGSFETTPVTRKRGIYLQYLKLSFSLNVTGHIEWCGHLSAVALAVQSIDPIMSIDTIYRTGIMELKLKDLHTSWRWPMSGISAAPRQVLRQPADAVGAVAQARGKPRRAADRAPSAPRDVTEAGRRSRSARAPCSRPECHRPGAQTRPIRWQASCAWPCADHRAVPAAADCTQAPQGTAAP